MDPFKTYEPKPRPVAMKMTPGDAETIALQVVAWIIGDDTMRDRFISITGCGADDLRNRIDQPAFLGSVLDFLLADESSVLAFADHVGLPPDVAMMARAKLPGWSAPN
ncbi:DUF3572 domain-containing protein [Paramagnetospirillum magneticum]|uniref:DUF3572 domain-containing protein n=1 Tax=Paramagnetospirillum magneticum (strain ATCC 700264 / AMB-1) TaxID=342108 RepID=Q2W5J9_PARM1|nr:DUF3572 domain-containing protein [Paramagnetospirillum magneticum]BAE50876.1 hypothetical protein amb2072 [Paramagnetospirillum magneticum AMB-1]